MTNTEENPNNLQEFANLSPKQVMGRILHEYQKPPEDSDPVTIFNLVEYFSTFERRAKYEDAKRAVTSPEVEELYKIVGEDPRLKEVLLFRIDKTRKSLGESSKQEGEYLRSLGRKMGILPPFWQPPERELETQTLIPPTDPWQTEGDFLGGQEPWTTSNTAPPRGTPKREANIPDKITDYLKSPTLPPARYTLSNRDSSTAAPEQPQPLQKEMFPGVLTEMSEVVRRFKDLNAKDGVFMLELEQNLDNVTKLIQTNPEDATKETALAIVKQLTSKIVTITTDSILLIPQDPSHYNNPEREDKRAEIEGLLKQATTETDPSVAAEKARQAFNVVIKLVREMREYRIQQQKPHSKIIESFNQSIEEIKNHLDTNPDSATLPLINLLTRLKGELEILSHGARRQISEFLRDEIIDAENHLARKAGLDYDFLVQTNQLLQKIPRVFTASPPEESRQTDLEIVEDSNPTTDTSRLDSTEIVASRSGSETDNPEYAQFLELVTNQNKKMDRLFFETSNQVNKEFKEKFPDQKIPPKILSSEVIYQVSRKIADLVFLASIKPDDENLDKILNQSKNPNKFIRDFPREMMIDRVDFLLSQIPSDQLNPTQIEWQNYIKQHRLEQEQANLFDTYAYYAYQHETGFDPIQSSSRINQMDFRLNHPHLEKEIWQSFYVGKLQKGFTDNQIIPATNSDYLDFVIGDLLASGIEPNWDQINIFCNYISTDRSDPALSANFRERFIEVVQNPQSLRRFETSKHQYNQDYLESWQQELKSKGVNFEPPEMVPFTSEHQLAPAPDNPTHKTQSGVEQPISEKDQAIIQEILRGTDQLVYQVSQLEKIDKKLLEGLGDQLLPILSTLHIFEPTRMGHELLPPLHYFSNSIKDRLSQLPKPLENTYQSGLRQHLVAKLDNLSKTTDYNQAFPLAEEIMYLMNQDLFNSSKSLAEEKSGRAPRIRRNTENFRELILRYRSQLEDVDLFRQLLYKINDLADFSDDSVGKVVSESETMLYLTSIQRQRLQQLLMEIVKGKKPTIDVLSPAGPEASTTE